MAKRRAGKVNDIIFELDVDDMSSDDEAKQTKMGRFEDEIRQKHRQNACISQETKATEDSEVISLDCSSDGICETASPNNTRNGGKVSQTEDNQTNCLKNEITVGGDENKEDLQNDTVIFHDHNIVVDSPSNSDLGVVGCENRTPLVTVRFKDRKLAHTYKRRIREFIINLLSSQSEGSETVGGDSDVELDIWPEELCEEEFDKDVEGDSFERDQDIEECGNDSEVDDSLFFVDTAPGKEVKTEVPKYSQTSSLISDIIEVEQNSPSTIRRGPTCFNCDGAHQLKDCTLPRNQNRIAAKRKAMPARVGRYHVEDEMKFGHLVPGRISGHLRHALGLKRYELPLHTYRMRILGYPPGWLEEARISHSGITLFDSTGNATQDPEEEDGELCEPGSKDKFDIKKILDFPGFNVPASSRYIEEAHLFGFPPMSEQDSKMEMLQTLAPNAMKAYKRKKLTFFPSASQGSFLEGQAEMELDSGDEIAEFPSIPPLPDEAPPPPPPPPPTPPPEEPPEVEKSDGELSDLPEEVSDNSQKINNNRENGKGKIEDVSSKNTVKGKRKYISCKDDELPSKEKKCLINDKIASSKGKNLASIKKDTANISNDKKLSVYEKVDLATSDDDVQVIEVMHVPDIPIPEDDLITIDDDDDDKLQLSSGPNSPSLATLEEKKKRLLNALKGDRYVSMEMVVLDETFSDSDDIEGDTEINEIKEENKGTSETDKEANNACETKPEKLSVELNDVNIDLKTTEQRKSDTEIVENEDVVKDIQVEKTSTVAELKNASTENSSDKKVGSALSEKSPDKEVRNAAPETPSILIDDEMIEIDKEPSVSTPDVKTGKVKDTSFGTPILNVASPFSKLPSDDKFAKDICDVINFENLPNSTGKYKKISSLLKRVKSAVDRIQDS